jgi:rhodanese-related sulfurtransferase
VVGARHYREPLSVVREAVAAGRAVLLDVRDEAEWARGHLRDAIPVPLSHLRDRRRADDWTGRVPMDRPVYIHCGAVGRSLIAAAILPARGYEARPLKPGFEELARVGFPTAA